jgi:hypothetical protein
MARGTVTDLHHMATGSGATRAAKRLAVLDILHRAGGLFRDMDCAAAKQRAACSTGSQFSEGHTN